VGFGFACATRPPTSESCWGLDWGGTATSPSDPFTWISAGYDDACFIVDGEIRCQGRKGAAPGTGTPPAGSFQQVETAMGHSCAISSSSGTVVCWGGDTWGESSPPVGGGYRWLAVGDAAGGGGAHSCAIAADGHVTCWGDHSYGKCAPPAEIFTRIDAAENYTCGVSASGQVWCWGLQARQPLD
jgi:alpha-tubulin suppressor-like RCC1 family protein